jgi:2-succinyl-5-enolpyruvyl-6-hydroxy-3-cyclohexene-1-carboxylate synthase
MPVRYASLVSLQKYINCTAWSNRGTSGIDGCISTGVGHAVNSDKMNIVLTGDMAFFYDRNGLWHNYVPGNLRIVILNNHGGGIFRLISGPKQLNELEEFFETKQRLNAANTAKDFGMRYFSVNNIEQLPEVFNEFFDPSLGASILEIETDARKNQEIYEEFMLQAEQL